MEVKEESTTVFSFLTLQVRPTQLTATKPSCDYSFLVKFHQMQYLWNSTNGGGDPNYYGTTFLASNYTLTVNVQQEPVSINSLPIIQSMPTEYWTRPIEGQNDQWYTVSSNWL